MTKIQATNKLVDQIDLKDIQKALVQKGKFLKQQKNKIQIQDLPDPILHKYLSFVKSGLRIVGCGVGIAGLFVAGFVFLLVAEIVGIMEEMV